MANRIIAALGAAGVLSITSHPALAGGSSWGYGGGYGHGYGMMDQYGHMGSGHFLFGILWLIILAGIVILTVLVIRRLWHVGMPSSGSSSARDTLDAMYAKGEIPREEYLQRREDLKG